MTCFLFLLIQSYSISLVSHANVSSAAVAASLPSSPPEGAIVVPDGFSTIQEAVDNAPEGGTVFVRSGSYREVVRVRKPLTLLGEDPETTIVSFDIESFLTNGVIEVRAPDVTISGFTLLGSWRGIWITDERPIPSRCKIIGNKIIDNVEWGISMGAGENHVVSGNNITGNGESSGIDVGSSNSVISGNIITGFGWRGITVSGSSNVTISGNNIKGNGADIDAPANLRGGLRLRRDGSFYVYGNNITDNQGYGIQFDGCTDSIIYQNRIENNSIGIELLNHRFTEDVTAGLNNIVYRNNIVDNSQQAFVDPEYDLAEKFPEHINGTDVVSWDNGTEGNYWSDYQTRYPNATEVGNSGIGDTPYVIAENNTDHYPIINPVTISSDPPPIPEASPIPISGSSSDLTLTIVVVVIIAIVVLVTVLVVYRMRKKVGTESLTTH